MGLFNFFKKEKKEEIEVLSFKDLDNWRLKKSLEISKNHQFLISRIDEKIDSLVSELIKNKEILEKITLEERKADDRIKLIVKENLDKYIINLRRLIENLESVDIEDYRMLIIRLDNLLLDFEKRSLMHYEKATILIGNELGKVKETIADFVHEIRRISTENENYIKDTDTMETIKEKISAFLAAKELLECSKNNLEGLNKEVDFHESEAKDTENIISEIKNTPEYQKEFELKSSLENTEKDYEKAVLELKSSIDFKELSNLFHSDPKKMAIINNYRDNFKDFLDKENCQGIILLLREGGLGDKIVLEKLDEVKSIENELKKEREFVNTNLIHFKDITAMDSEIRKHKAEILSIRNEKVKEEKKLEKLDEALREAHENLKRELLKMNINLLD